MAQLQVTLAMMRAYIRGLDERLDDTTKYPDSWIDGKINTAFEVIATRRQPWLTEEIYNINTYVNGGIEYFTLEMQEDIVGFKRIFYSIDNVMIYPTTNVAVEIDPDHKINVMINLNNIDGSVENTLTFQYWYIPTVPAEDSYMSMPADVYHMLRHGMEFAVYESLRDIEKFQWAERKIEQSARSVINGLDIDIACFDQWNGGFIN